MNVFNRLKRLLHPKKAKEEVKEKALETTEKPKVKPKPKKLPRKGSPEDFALLFEEMRRTLWIIKNATAHLYVQWYNLKDKFDKKTERGK